MKKMKTRYIELGISLFLLVLFNFGSNTPIFEGSASEPQATLTEIFPDRIEVISPNSIFFTIHVTANGNPVPSGQVTVYEETDTFYSATGTVYNGIAFIEWIPKSWTPTGWCTFIASYGGYNQYEASTGNTQVLVDASITPGSTETQTSSTPSQVLAYPSDTVDFDVTIDIINSIFPLFSGGYIVLFDQTENIALQHEEIVDLMASTYTTTLSVTIPALYANGSHTIETRFSGSYDVDLAASSDSCVIEVINNNTQPIPENYSLSMTGNTTVLNRGIDSILIQGTVDGDDPNGETIRLYSYQDNGSISSLLDETILSSRDYTYMYTPDETDLTGPILFELNLHDDLTDEVKASASISATIVDPIIIYNTTISMDQDIYEVILGDFLNIPVYITSSSDDPITDGQLYCYVQENNTTLQEFTAHISQGYTTFEIFSGDFNEGNFQLTFSYPGNETQTTATYTAEMHIIKTTAIFESEIISDIIEYGDTTYWTAHVTNDIGTGIPEIPIKFETSLTGFYWDHWGTIMTDNSGYATMEIIWLDENQEHYGNPGNYDIRISIDENDKVYTDEQSHSLSVTKNQVILTLDNNIIAHLGTGIIQGTLTTSYGDPIANAEIELYWNCTYKQRWERISILTTDDFGQYFQEVTIEQPPEFYGLRAEYDGDTYYASAVESAILEVIDNPTEIKKIEITPTILDLGDITLINVTANDIDSISSVTAIIYNSSVQYTITLDYINSTYQKTIWCDTQYQIGTWFIDLIVIDNLGIETIFTHAGQFVISDNPAPTVTYTVTPDTIPDGASVDIEITATDTLGIKSVKIEIDSTLYDITENMTIIDDNNRTIIDIDNQRKMRLSSTDARAREVSIFYFHYSPSIAGIIPFTIYVEDNAGQIREIHGSIMVEAVAPELSVLSISKLNGTAPFSFALELKATDGSGINNIWIYLNDQEYELQYNESNDIWLFTKLLSASDYIITIIAEDTLGTQAILDMGTLNVKAAEFSVLYASENLFDGENTTFTLQGSSSLAHANVDIAYNNQRTSETLDANAILTGELIFSKPDIYVVQFVITDSLGTQLSKEYTFDVATKAPEIQSIYPTSTVLAGMYTPLTLNVEALVFDASGVNSVVLYVNSAQYPLNNSVGLWYGTVDLQEGNYSLNLVATDIYGAETTYSLGNLTTQATTTTTTSKPSDTSSETSEATPTTTDLIATVSMIGITVATAVGTVLVKWKKRI